MKKNSLAENFNELDQIILFENIKKDQIVNDFKMIFNNNDLKNDKITSLIYKLVEFNNELGLEGDIWHNYLKSLLIKSENVYSLNAEKNLIDNNSSIYKIALSDLKIINNLFNIKFKDLLHLLSLYKFEFLKDFKALELKSSNINLYNSIFNHNQAEDNLKELNYFFKNYGVSILNESRAFYWENKNLKAVNNYDQISFEQIIAYEKQKEKLIKNTKSFLNKKKAHNVLLYGDSGTGKSSSVKALLNKFYDQGLRLIEISSSQIKELPDILEYLNTRGLYFIIFMDDLSFEEFETDYKYLKAVMEGGIESKPDNVLFYATSNRRHLVREKWQDRQSEIHENDILNEKLSLSERFGLTLMFNSPAQEEYLRIVNELAKQENISLEAQLLEERALEWSRWNNGRSGRTARQFIDQLLKENN